MAETKSADLEREYTIPLRRFWLNVPRYERTRKAVKAIKIFIAKHMKVPGRDVDNVRLDVYFNNELWFKGRANPPAKIKVKAKKENNIVRVSFAEIPAAVKFIQQKHAKIHKKTSEVKEKTEQTKPSETKEKTEESKKDEKEKEIAVEQQNIKQAEQQKKDLKHTTKIKQPKINRMALQK